jgi:hypothetical protein
MREYTYQRKRKYMPNWCYDRLEVIGQPEEVADFKTSTTNADGHFSFDCLVPMPEALRQPDGGDGWYNWSVDNWGTKWDVRGEEVQIEHHVTATGLSRLTLDFMTAWAPPTEWLAKVSTQLPHLKFSLWFDEPGACFAGKETFENGIMVPSLSWSGESVDSLNCAVRDCEEWVEGRSVVEFDSAPKAEDLEAFCEDHALVKEVIAAGRADGENLSPVKSA